jgi:mannose-6-phosphate isomerase-like protein (cupin superfamily)
MRPTTAADVAKFDRFDSAMIARCTVPAGALAPAGGLSEFDGFEECPIVGCANAAEGAPAGPIAWAHGFQLRALRIAPGARSPAHVRDEEEVLLVHSGRPVIDWNGGSMVLGAGDTLTVPKGLARVFANAGDSVAVVYVVRGGDHPAPARIVHQATPGR